MASLKASNTSSNEVACLSNIPSPFSTADIKIIQEPLVSYGSCDMPYVIEGLMDDFEKLIARSALLS